MTFAETLKRRIYFLTTEEYSIRMREREKRWRAKIERNWEPEGWGVNRCHEYSCLLLTMNLSYRNVHSCHVRKCMYMYVTVHGQSLKISVKIYSSMLLIHTKDTTWYKHSIFVTIHVKPYTKPLVLRIALSSKEGWLGKGFKYLLFPLYKLSLHFFLSVSAFLSIVYSHHITNIRDRAWPHFLCGCSLLISC